MSYHTILVHADLSRHAPGRIRLAARVANAEGAHLVGVAMSGISRFASGDTTADLARSIVAGYLDTLYDNANRALDQFESIAREAGVASFERRLVSDDPEGGLVLQARFCDLVVISQTDPDHSVPGVVHDLPEYVVLNCARPVLIVPYAGQFERIDGKALVAWDGSMEATRAMTSAIPLLRYASEATVMVFNSPTLPDAPGAPERADLAAFLARHRVRAGVLAQTTELDTGDALLSLAADLQSDLIVMGAYGHTRFRELLLGGATKTVLRTMTVPVLMAH